MSLFSLVQDAIKGVRHICHVQKVARVGAVSVDGEWHALEELIGELWDQFLRELVRTVDIIPASDEDGKFEGTEIALDEELSASLGGGVWICRLKDVILHHGIRVKVFTFTVYFVGRDVNEAPDRRTAFGTFQEDVSSVNVGMSEGKGVSE